MRIYFSGIGGVGIGPLAQIALDAGYEVVGSDISPSLMTEQLEQRGIQISYDQSGKFFEHAYHVQKIDWFVHTSALNPDNPELVLARKFGARIAKRDELLAHIIAEKKLKLLAVAGTHGKTSATAMTVWALKQRNVPVSYSIGTTLSWGASGTYDAASEYFVYECDEFDRNMLHFSPHATIITSLDYDHPDTYPTPESYFAAFDEFIGKSRHTIVWKHDTLRLQPLPKSTWQLRDSELLPLQLPGIHTRQNATLVTKLLEYLELGDAASTAAAIESFPGTSRRFEKLAPNLYTDYGHHPAEIAATLQMASEMSEHVVLVYQPHQNVRQHDVKDQYTSCMDLAEHVYWLPTYLSREDASLPVLSPQELTKNVNNKHITYGELNQELWSHIQIELHKGNLVLCMGAGSIDGWLREKLQ